MSGSTETYSFEIKAEIEAARKAVEDFAKDTQESLNKLNISTAITAIKEGFDFASGIFEKVKGFLADCSSEAAKTEENIRLLNNAMRVTGEYTDEASQSMRLFADNLAKVTTYSDDAILQSLALGKTFGLSNQEAKKLAATAADLAAFTGQDLASATQVLAATYNGFVNRELKHMDLAFAGLTKTQLENGAAIDLVAKKLKGSAADAIGTFAGQQAQRQKEFEDFEKAIGGTLNNIKLTWFRWGKDIVGYTKDAFAAIKRDTLSAGNELQESIFDNVHKAIQRNGAASLSAILKEDEATKKARIQRAKEQEAEIAAQRLEAFKSSWIDKKKQLELDSLGESARIDKEYAEKEAEVRKAFSLKLIKSKDEENRLLEGLDRQRVEKQRQLLERIRAEAEAAEQKLHDTLKKRFDDLVKDPVEVAIKFGLQNVSSKDAIAIGAGLFQNIAKGAKGAQGAISQGIADIIGFAVGGPLGEAIVGPVSEIVNLLAQGPDAVKKTVTEFARAIPDIIKNIAAALPVLVETLVEELPPALAKAMPQVAIGFSTALIAHIPDIVKGFIEGLKDVPQAIVDGIKEALGNLGGGVLNGITGSGGSDSIFSGIPVLQGVGDFFGFAEGGTIPDSPSARGDKVLTRADAGETFIDRSLTQKLQAFLDNGGGGGPQTIVLQVGQAELARVILNLNRGGYRTA